MCFYKYIVRNGNSYKIMKDNESYGTYQKLSDALYERDRLIKAEWDWEGAVHIEETNNKYESMVLPEFNHDYSYIYRIPSFYRVFIKDKFCKRFGNKGDAYEYANKVGGRVVSINERYRVQKRINGRPEYFGQYDTFEEAKKVRDKLIENGWKT